MKKRIRTRAERITSSEKANRGAWQGNRKRTPMTKHTRKQPASTPESYRFRRRKGGERVGEKKERAKRPIFLCLEVICGKRRKSKCIYDLRKEIDVNDHI